MTTTFPLFTLAEQQETRTALMTEGHEYSYRQLLTQAARLARILQEGRGDLQEQRIALLVPPSCAYVSGLWGIWQAGGIAVPLGPHHPPPEWDYVLGDTQASVVVVSPRWTEKIRPLAETRGIRVIEVGDTPDASEVSTQSQPIMDGSRRALILYTSGTTSKPKGVVTTFANLQAQVETLLAAWEWTADDRILHVLPLHHVHGIVNALLCALWAGATCVFLARFEARTIWQCFEQRDISLFMAVPTMYAKLISAWEQATREEQHAWSKAATGLRLMVSGSAALPVSTLQQWQSITSHTLLERYGMTEIGMALSNPVHGERRPGHVGTPLPGVTVRLVDETGDIVGDGVSGEIEVRGPMVFHEYWQRPDATAVAFRDGWFRTGDVAIRADGMYRILGRTSVDIIKTGGYKVSALEIEEVLRDHAAIQECAVVSVPDDEWGEVVAVCIVPRGQALGLEELRRWAKERLAHYKVPRRLLVVQALPRNAMGKVQKPAVVKLLRGSPPH